MGDSSAESDVDECSGISQPTLLEQLKGILDEYRNDVQIVKELVQNADDAGASEMKILYIGSNVNEEQKQGQNILKGPALIFYNDAKFSKLDWKGIKSIYSSVKRDDPLKVGRFGLGFKSVFHMTDNPCIVSGKKILFINPLEKDSRYVCISVELKNLKKSKRLDSSSIINALNGLFGFSKRTIEDGFYPGTLFWFSLRQMPSKLSSDIYQDHQVNRLLEAFMDESCRSLIFLKTLCSVHIYVELKVIQDSPAAKRRRTKVNEISLLDCLNFGRNRKCFSAVISNANKENKCLIDRRRDVLLQLEGIGMSIPNSPKHWVFDVIVEINRRAHNKNDNITKSRWLIVTYFKGQPISSDTQLLLMDKELKYPPIVSLAAPISETGGYVNISTHVFCYQPLPQENTLVTGLPVHINAFFDLGKNRRNIRWPDIDKNGQELKPDDNKIKWNLALRSEFLPYAYCQLCVEMIHLSEKTKNETFIVNAVYNIIPDLRNIGEHWAELAERVLVLLGEKTIIHTESNRGVWLKPKNALLMNKREFKPLTCSKEAQDTVYGLLCKDNVRVADVPEHVIYSLDEIHHDELTFVTPKILKEHLHKHSTYKDLDFQKKIQLMKFILLDKDGDGIESIELVPLADGTFTSFSNKNVYSEPDDVMKLFPGKENMFLHRKLKEETRQRLEQISITSMNDVDAAKLLSAILCENFRPQRSGCIIVEDKNWIKWIEQVWLFIQQRFMKHIATFEGIPLFPITNSSTNTRISKVKLISLPSLLLHLPSDQKIQNERKFLEESFQLLSVSIVKYIPNWISRTTSEKYLYEDCEPDITFLFEQIDEQNIRYFNENISDTHRSNFLTFLSSRLDKISENSRSKFKRMKLFKGFLKSGQMSVFSVSESKYLYTGSSFPVRYPIDLIVVKSKKEIYFAKTLGGTVVPELEMIDHTFKKLNKFSQEEMDTFIEWVIESKHFESAQVLCHLRSICFLRTKSKKLHKPCELFDPDDKLLMELFRDADVFPDGQLGPNKLKKLRVLGLKTVKHVTKSDIHSICDAIDKRCNSKNEICERQCIALRKIMEDLSLVFEKQYLWQKRCIILEQTGEQPKLYSTHNTGKFVLCRPSDIKSSKHSNLIKTEMYLIDSNKFPKLSRCFGWNKPPSDQQVINHLFNIVEHYSDKMDKYINIYDDIYSFLDKACINNAQLVLNQLQHKKVIWVDGSLTYPEKVAENTSHDCRPHLYSLQMSPLKQYSALRECLGIQKRFSAKIFAHTLHHIKEHVGERPVKSSDIPTILNLLQCFKLASGHKSFEGVVYGPDENCILRNCKTLCFNDFDCLEKSDTMNYSHPDMPKSLAKELGVKPKLLHNIEENSEDFEDFYQDEPLLTRIQNLIEGYPCDIGIFKELLQNADDAKASQMHFLLDYDTHPDLHIFHKKYGELQGPALCVFNNSSFSEKDLSAIKLLGRGNKSDDMFKAGRYGVGFNAVYNLTDVPSLLTWGGDIEHKETLCFFDPMVRFIPGKTKSKPGIRYKNVATIRKHSNDLLKGFHENYFRKLSGQSGTIFRLPLRRRALAKVSEIKRTPIEVEMVSELLDKFCTELKNIILFLKHLNMVKITVHRKGAYIGQFRIDRYIKETQTKRYSDLIQTQKKFSKAVIESSQNMLKFRFQSEVCEMTLKETLFNVKSHSHNDYIVLHTTGFKYPKDIPTLLCEQIKSRNIGFLPSGAVAIRKETKIIENEQCLAYCFLPLPIHTGLPVHVHGYFALDNETRRTLWKSENEKMCYKSLWNIVLLEQVIAPAYSLLIDYIRKSMIESQKNRSCEYASISDHLKNYLSVLPTDNLASDFYWKHLTKCVYKELLIDCVPFLPILKTSTKQNSVLSWTPLQIEGHKFPAYRNASPSFDEENNFFRDLELLERI